MTWLMAVILTVLTIFAYLKWKRSLISPCFLLCFAILASYIVVLLNYNNWQVQITGTFVLYVTTAIVAFGLGAIAVDLCCGSGKNSQDRPYNDITAITKVKYPAGLLGLISILLTAFYIFKLLHDVEVSSSFSVTLRRIYENIVNNNYSPGFIYTQMSEIVRAIAYLSTFRLVVRLFLRKRGDRISVIKLAVPIVMFLLMTLISTDRNILLRFFIFTLCVIVAVHEQTRHKRSNIKIILIVLSTAVIALLIFYLFGKAKLYQSNISRALSIYGGSGLYCFNLWLNDFNGQLMYGESTFSVFLNSMQSILAPFNVDFGISLDRFDPSIIYNSPNGYVFSSNIYSSLKPYVEDFGYLGVILFPFIIGVFLQWLYRKYKAKSLFACLMYCALIYFIIYMPIQEQCFRRLHLGMFYEIVWFAVIYFCVFGKKRLQIGRQCLYDKNSYGVKRVRQ